MHASSVASSEVMEKEKEKKMRARAQGRVKIEEDGL
jgi:hypothetical protein